jgi:hypothetical protein
MSPLVAFHVITWAAIVLLFFGLAAVLRELRLLRGLVTRSADGFAAAPPDLSLGGSFADGHGERIVLAATSGCPLCVAVAKRLADRATGAVLLTYEPPEAWHRLAQRLEVLRDHDAWHAVAHLSPPVLMLVDGSGRVRRMLLPVREGEVDSVLDEWGNTAWKGKAGVSDTRSDS